MTSFSMMLASFFNLQPMELLILGALLLLIFGSRLPEVGKSLGRGIVEFKKGLKGIDEEVNQSTRPPAGPYAQQQAQWPQQQAQALPPGAPPYPAQQPQAGVQAGPGQVMTPGQPHA